MVFIKGEKHSEKWYAIMKNQTWNKGKKGKSKKWYNAMKKLCGKNHHNYKGGSVSSQGYKELCINGKRILEHRYIMEKHLGRKLEKGEVIHHLNGNKLDNKISNLILISSNSQHSKLHYPKGSKFGANKNFEDGWSREFEKCIECGTTDRKHCGKGLCKNCSSRRDYRNNIEEKRKKGREYQKKYYKNNLEKCRKSMRKYQRRIRQLNTQ